MPFLQTFDFELFLSYGWSRNPREDQGSRKWAASLRDILADRLGRDRERPRIFFDRDADRSAPITDELRRAAEQSALLVFIVSPGSCRPSSYCQMEAAYFWDYAKPLIAPPDVLAPENRIIKVVQTPVPEGMGVEPEALRDLPSFDLFDPDGRTGNDLKNLDETARHELERLYRQILTSLDRVRNLERYRDFKSRVFVSSAFPEANWGRFRELRRELLMEGHEVASVTPLPAGTETEDEFRRRAEYYQEKAVLAVHLVPEHLETPNNWTRNSAANLLRYSLRKSTTQKSFSIYLWQDPEKGFDEQCSRQIEEIPLMAGDQCTTTMDFGDLKANVKHKLRQPARPPTEAKPRYDVVIEHWDVDSDDAAAIRDHIEGRGLTAQFAIPTQRGDNRVRRQKKNQTNYYSKAERFLVLYGHANDEWADDVCFGMSDFIRRPSGGLVLLAPPPEPPHGKRHYRAPVGQKFVTKPCLDRRYGAALDEWLGQHGD
jgi:hypothetical protein